MEQKHVRFSTRMVAPKTGMETLLLQQQQDFARHMQEAAERMTEQLFAGALSPAQTTSAAEPPPLTFEAILKAWDDANKPPVLDYSPALAKMLEEAVAAWESEGTAREDLAGAMLLIPWEVSGRQTLETPYGRLEIHFTKHAEKPLLLAVKKSWLELDSFLLPANPYGVD